MIDRGYTPVVIEALDGATELVLTRRDGFEWRRKFAPDRSVKMPMRLLREYGDSLRRLERSGAVRVINIGTRE